MPSSAPLSSMPSGRAVPRVGKPAQPPATLLQRVILPRQADPLAVRARDAGYPTATVPGVAIWRMSFADKDDATDWQAYSHVRNRLVGVALHSTLRCPKLMLADSLTHECPRLRRRYRAAAEELSSRPGGKRGFDG
ncbi:MAG: hypothetical protein ACRDTF_18400 [Pseudonocardiaceae bacterium]